MKCILGISVLWVANEITYEEGFGQLQQFQMTQSLVAGQISFLQLECMQ